MSDIKIFKPGDKVECVAWGCGKVTEFVLKTYEFPPPMTREPSRYILVYFSAVDQSFSYNTDGTPVSGSPETAHNYTLTHRTKKKK